MTDDLLALFDTPASPAPSGERMCASCGNVPTSSPRTNTCARCAAAGFEPGRLELDGPAPAELVDVADPLGLFAAAASTPRPVVTPPAKRGPRCSFCGQRDRDTERCAANLAKLNPPATCPLAPPARRPEALALDVGPGRRPHECTPTDCAYPCTDLEGAELAALLVLWCDENALTLAARTLREAIRDHEAGTPRDVDGGQLAGAIEYARRSLLDDWPIAEHESSAEYDARIAAGIDPHDPATWDGPAEPSTLDLGAAASYLPPRPWCVGYGDCGSDPCAVSTRSGEWGRCPACGHSAGLHSGPGATASTPGTCDQSSRNPDGTWTPCPCPGWHPALHTVTDECRPWKWQDDCTATAEADDDDDQDDDEIEAEEEAPWPPLDAAGWIIDRVLAPWTLARVRGAAEQHALTGDPHADPVRTLRELESTHGAGRFPYCYLATPTHAAVGRSFADVSTNNAGALTDPTRCVRIPWKVLAARIVGTDNGDTLF